MLESFTKSERTILRKLNTPRKIQDFIDTIPMNFGETCMSPRRVLRENKAHCMEGAMLAAAALRVAGWKPLLLDLKTKDKRDVDHVVAVFQIEKCWGAISKTNHGVLRYREPIYRTIRELVLSYFHEYFLDDGTKTLRSYSAPYNLSQLDELGWMTDEDDVWYVCNYLDDSKHFPLLTRSQLKNLRPADKIEREMGKIIEWKPSGKKLHK